MMGRKLEEGDWSNVYCKAKNIPNVGWSNLHIDVSYQGLGLEMKLLRIADLNGKPLKSVCGETLMHPAATRSIRIDDTNADAQQVMEDVFAQYADLIQQRTERVRAAAPPGTPIDMRVGWLIWEDDLTEFLYFENRCCHPTRPGTSPSGIPLRRGAPGSPARACESTTKGRNKSVTPSRRAPA